MNGVVDNVIALHRTAPAAVRGRDAVQRDDSGLYVPVTRKESAIGGTERGSLPGQVVSDHENPIFLDWLTIRQTHHSQDVPIFRDGQVLSVDADGSVEWVTDRRVQVEGSYDSRVMIRSDGSNVEFSGNPTRFARRDNLFGFSFEDSIQRVNHLLNLHSLPPFSAGLPYRFADSGVVWSGARVSRADVTLNFATFSLSDARAVLSDLAGHHLGRQKHNLTPDGSTLSIGGQGSRYVYHKIYLKSHEIQVHRKRRSGQHVASDVEKFCQDYGILREEMTLKSRFLTQNRLAFLGDITQSRLNAVFFHRSAFRRFDQVKYQNFSDLPPAIYGTYCRWRDGLPLDLAKTTFYRHRRSLLQYGVDIAVPNNVTRLPLRVRTVDVAAMVAPDWYRCKYG